MTVVYDHGGGGSSGSQGGSSNSIDAVTLAADSNSMNRNPPVSPPSQANRHLFDNEEHSDVKFIVGYGRGSTWRFPGHTKVLAETNEVFRDLFRQHNLVHNRTIYIENVEKRGFEQLLRFLYGHKVEFPSLYTAIDTLRAAEVFDCAPLAAVCIIHIDSNLEETNALNVFRSLGSPNGTPTNGHGPSAPPSIVSALIGELRHNCLVIIDKEAKTILRSETMEELSREQLECVLRRKSLQVNKEFDVWLTLDRWLNRECKRTNVENTNAAKRRVLGPTKFVVKFSTMKKSEFLNGPAKILCVNEKEEILNRMKLATKNSWRDQEVALPKPLSARTNDGVTGCARSDGNNNKRSKTRTGKEKLNCVMDCVCRTLICFFD